jgi:hypothetical protein
MCKNRKQDNPSPYRHCALHTIIIKKLFLLGSIILFLTAGCDNTPHVFTQSVYIWQRAWNESTADATRKISQDIEKFYVLAAEIELSKKMPNVVFVDPDYEVLRQTNKPIALCIRIGVWQGPFSATHVTTKTVISTIQNRISQYRKNGIEPDEIQIDFDCSESNLAGYRQWLTQIREVCETINLSITVLPSWLKQKGFKKLIDELDSFVLQVHGLQKSSRNASRYTLFTSDKAVLWTQQAAKFKKAFTVALPTYGYRLVFDNSHQLVDTIAEETSPRVGTSSTLIKADPYQIAQLINKWQATSIPWMRGIVWYRLPTNQDRLNWTMDTLREVMHGRTPQKRLIAYFETEKIGLQRVWLENTGQTIINDFEIKIGIERATVLAADVTSNNHILHNESVLIIKPKNGRYVFLRPREKYSPGWMRLLEENAQLTISVQ